MGVARRSYCKSIDEVMVFVRPPNLSVFLVLFASAYSNTAIYIWDTLQAPGSFPVEPIRARIARNGNPIFEPLAFQSITTPAPSPSTIISKIYYHKVGPESRFFLPFFTQ